MASFDKILDSELLHEHQGDEIEGGKIGKVIPVESVSFDNLYTTTGTEPSGTIFWNEVDGTLDIRLKNNTTLQTGQEMYFYVKASGNIANGELCQFAGVQGDHILAKKVVPAEIIANPHYLVGVATQNITNGEFGYITWFGKVNGVYTKTPANNDSVDWVAGDILYFDNVTGQLTKAVPEAPNRNIKVAAVVKTQTGSSENGIILIRPTFGLKVSDLDDVSLTSVQEDDILLHDTNVWENKPFSTTGTQTHNAGWLNRTITPTITVSAGVLNYTLTGTTTYYVSGKKYNVTDFTSGNRSMTKGNRYFFYVDTANAQQFTTTPWDISALAAPTLLTYYYDDTHYIPVEERHGSRRNPHAHRELHFQIGCYWTSGDGIAITSYTLDSSTAADWKWALETGTVHDEDIATTISAWASGSYNNMYRELTTGYWYWDAGATIPFKIGANSRVTYNNPTGWTQTEAGVGQCVNYYICAFPSLNANTQIMIVQGQNFYANENSAVNATIANDVAWGTLPSEEIKVLYQVTIQASATGDKNFIANVKDVRASNQALQIGASATVSSHNSLSGLQGGAAGEYYHLTSTELSGLHSAVTVTDTTTVDLTLTGQALSADVKPAGISHNDLANKQGGTAGEYNHLTNAELTELQAVDSTYLKLDASNDPITGALTQTISAGANTATNDFTSTLTITDQDMTANRTSTGITNTITNNNSCSADWPSYNYIYGLSNIIFNSGTARLWQGVGILNQVSNTASDATYNEIRLSQGLYNYMYQNNANAVTTTVYGIDNYINNNAGTMTNATGMYIHFAGTIANKVGINVTGETSNSLSGSLTVGGAITGGNIPIAETSITPIVSVPAQTATSTFIALINGAPTNVANSVVTFDTVTAGNVAVITPATTCMAKMKMYNVTRGNYALIVSATGSTFTVDRNVTTLAAPWQNNDAIQITSSVMGGLGSLNWVDYEFTTGLTGRSAAFIKLQLTSTATGTDILRLHPYTSTTSTSKYDALVGVAGITQNGFGLFTIIGDSLCLSWTGTPSSFTVREAGYLT